MEEKVYVIWKHLSINIDVYKKRKNIKVNVYLLSQKDGQVLFLRKKFLIHIWNLIYDKNSIVHTQGRKVFMLKPDTEYSK